MQKKNIIRIAIGVGLILLIPLVMTIHDGAVEGVGWNWTPFDFIVMGTLLFGMGLVYEFFASKATEHRVIIGIGVFFATVLIWTELAVGAVSQLVHYLLTL